MTALAASMICVVDDDESVRVATAALLRSAGFRVESFNSAESFLERGQVQDFSCLILDLRMPGIDGLETQRRLNATDSTLPIIFISAHDDPLNRKKAMDAGAAAFFHKPFHGDSLLAAIASAVGGRCRVKPFGAPGSGVQARFPSGHPLLTAPSPEPVEAKFH